MYRMMLSDLDETLIVNHRVPADNQKAIYRLQKKGIKFVPASGRAYDTLVDVLKDIGTYDKEDEYCICFNGGAIIENKNRNILLYQGISFDVCKMLFEKARNYDVCVMIFTIDCCYLFNADPLEVQRKIDQKASFKVIEDYNMDFLCDAKIVKILFERRDMDYLMKIKEDLLEDIKDKVDVSFSSYRYMEFMGLGVNKGNALKWLANYLGIDVSEVIAIGDNYNDIEMLETAGFGACVSSSYQIVRDVCDYVCYNDYNQGAVKEVIEKFVLEDEV